MRRALAVVAVAFVFGGCAAKNDKSTVSAYGSSPTTRAPVGHANTFNTTLVNGKPHFATPEDAMRFLAQAWNANDLESLKHVTNPAARDQLNAMHGVATNLRLNHCSQNAAGDYTCYFDHDYPPGASTTMPTDMATANHGQAVFLVGPATTPGWYMTVFESCS